MRLSFVGVVVSMMCRSLGFREFIRHMAPCSSFVYSIYCSLYHKVWGFERPPTSLKHTLNIPTTKDHKGSFKGPVLGGPG